MGPQALAGRLIGWALLLAALALGLACAPTQQPEPAVAVSPAPGAEPVLTLTVLQTLPAARAAAREWMDDALVAGVLEFAPLDLKGRPIDAVVWTFCSMQAANQEPGRMPRDADGRPLYRNQLKVQVIGADVRAQAAAGAPQDVNEDPAEINLDSDAALQAALAQGGAEFLARDGSADISARLLSGSAAGGYFYSQQDAAAADEPYERALPKSLEQPGLLPHWLWCVRLERAEPFERLELFLDGANGVLLGIQRSQGRPDNYVD